jgi:serine/threonine protein kinase
MSFDGSRIFQKPNVHNVYHMKGELLWCGRSGIVELLGDNVVQKSPLPGPDYEESRKDIELEFEMYRLLGHHDRLVKMIRHTSEGLFLEYMVNRDLKTYLQKHQDISTGQRLRWACEAAEGLQLLHSKYIIHCDIKPRNFLLDADLNLKIIDFAGSTISGSRSNSCEQTRYYLPRDWREPPTTTTDLFALGSTIYEIMTGISPYGDLPSNEVRERYKDNKFPDISSVPCGEVIRKCWECDIVSAQQALDSIKAFIKTTAWSS